MKTEEVAKNLVTWFNNHEEARCYQELYSPNAVSIEPGGDHQISKGMEEIAKKGEWWKNTFEVHSTKAVGPIVADDWFSVRFDMDTTHKPSGQRSEFSEIGVFQVEKGKIVKEQFFYNMG
jgi:limonene-1,2-epoxide hydrolase